MSRIGRASRAYWLLARCLVLASVGALLLDTNALLAAPSAGATVSAQPSAGAPGAQVTLSGANSPKRRHIVLTWDGSSAGLPTTTASATGSFSVQLAIPQTATVGTHQLLATAGRVSAAAAIQVQPVSLATSTPTPTATPAPGTGPDVTMTVDRGNRAGTSQLSLGVTHTRYSLDSWGDQAAVSAGKQLLQQSTVVQNQSLMGWGGGNPEPSPGVYDWSTLDARLDTIRQSGGTPAITLCCAPDWMAGGAAGTTDWSHFGYAPTPEHYADFAALAAQVARRYPDVKYFQVWSELRTFWNASQNRWDYESYTTFYNQVYDALKAVSPDIQVGGPYVVMDSWGNRPAMSNPSDVSGPYGTLDQRPLDVISYWLANKHGADFITVAVWEWNWDGVQVADEFTATQKFTDVAAWIRQRTSLPIWWAECGVTDLLGPATQAWDHQHQSAVLAATLVRAAYSGVAVPLRWQPQGVQGQPFQGDQESLFSDTRFPGGGQPFPYYYAAKAFHDNFGPGTPLYRATTSSPGVAVLASDTKTLLINESPTPLQVSVDGAVTTLEGYEVRVL